MRISPLSLAVVFALLVIPSVQAAPDRTMTVTAGQSAVWTGYSGTTGTNLLYWQEGAAQYACTRSTEAFCEMVLLKFENPVPLSDADGRLIRSATITLDPAQALSDYDIRVLASNSAGWEGHELARARTTPALSASGQETVSFNVVTTREDHSSFVLVEVVYRAATGGYTATVDF